MTHQRNATGNATPLPSGLPPCETCGGAGGEVWPCPFCKQPLHVECGHGVEYREADWLSEVVDGHPVIGAWHCAECGAVAGLDIAEPEGNHP